MIITTATTTWDDCRTGYKLVVDDEYGNVKMYEFGDGEPEDNSLCRNFSEVFQITSLMQQAHDNGKDEMSFVLNSLGEISEDDWAKLGEK